MFGASRLALVLALVANTTVSTATARSAARELCRPGASYRGAPIDLDVQRADLHEVFRLLSDVGRINLIVADDVRGTVTLRVHRVPWQRAACTVASLHGLTITIHDGIYLVRRRASAMAMKS